MEQGATARARGLPQIAKYEVLEEIGHGGMATVYRARDTRLAREVAIKVIHPHLRDSAEVAHRFSVEAKAVAKLRHGNIVEVFDVSAEDEPEQYLVVELLRGVTLRKLLQKHGALPPEVAAALAIELLNALAHAHGAGVVHRDIKPENVIIEQRRRGDGEEPPGERIVVKLTDFGIAKLLDAQGVTSTGQVLGSPAHMAPEQIEGGEVDARADVFGLGVLLYECMVGHLPFEGNNPAQVLRRVLEGIYPPADTEREIIGKTWSVILDHALAHDPADRFADAASMRDELQRELKRLGIASSRSELEAWSDDPEGYQKRHDEQLIGILCREAAEARKKGDALAAAADYNRALAYAPHDPALLKIVGSLHRADARARFLKQAARIGAAMLLLGVIAFFVTSALRPKITPDVPRVSATIDVPARPLDTASRAPDVPSSAPSDTATVEAPTSATAPSSAPTLIHLPRPPVSVLHPREINRGIVVSVQPQVAQVSLDGGDFVTINGSHTFTVHDAKPHSLHVKCVDEKMCVAATRLVPEGEADFSAGVVLKIKDATLTVIGDPSTQYSIIERNLTVGVGVPVVITMTRGGSETLTVTQLNSGKPQRVTVFAGKAASVTFGD